MKIAQLPCGDMEEKMNQYEKRLENDLKKRVGLSLEEVYPIAQYPFDLSFRILQIFIQWACQPQNDTGIMMGREKVSLIDNKKWLQEHLIDAAKECIDLSDEWEYRRFVELVIVAVPELKEKAVEIGMLSDNEDIREAADDYKNMERL